MELISLKNKNCRRYIQAVLFQKLITSLKLSFLLHKESLFYHSENSVIKSFTVPRQILRLAAF